MNRERGSIDVEDVFERTAPSGEPLTTTEVADAMGCSRRTAYNRLETAVEHGTLRTKKVGARGRVWWRQPTHDWKRAQLLDLEFRFERFGRELSDSVNGDIQITVDGDVPLSDGSILQYYTATGIAPDDYIDFLERYPTIRDIRLLSTVDDTCRVEARLTDDSVAAVFYRFGGRTKSGGQMDSLHWITGELPRTVNVEEVLKAVRRAFPGAELSSEEIVHTDHSFRIAAREEMTNRQWTALRSAYHAGYFDQPRTSTGEELADRMGITPQTFHHHLRRSQKIAFSRLFRAATDSE